MGKILDLTGQRFGLWTVVRRDGSMSYGGKAYICRCDCGNEGRISSGSLRKGDTESCGCVGIQKLVERSTTHGLYRHPLRKTWQMMKDRCYSENHEYFSYYGGRGITVCERWRNGESGKTGFECFLADMGPKPHADYEIDRKDNDLNYTPENCHWIPQAEQAVNRSNTIQLTFEGRTQPLVTWAKERGMSVHALRNRYYKRWPHDKILTTPVL